MVRKAPSRDKCPRGYRPTPGQRVDDLQLGAKATLHDVQSLNSGPERSRDEFVAPVDRGQCPSHANPTQVTCGRLPPQSRGRGGTCHRRGKRSWRNPSPVPLRSGPLPELHVIRRQRSIARSREITPDGAAHERCLLPRMLGVPAQPRSCKTGRVGRQSLPGQIPPPTRAFGIARRLLAARIVHLHASRSATASGPCRSLSRMPDLSRGRAGEYGVLRAATGACYASISWAEGVRRVSEGPVPPRRSTRPELGTDEPGKGDAPDVQGH